MDFPGGNLVPASGGYLQLWNWSTGGSLTSADPINYRYMDVAWWKLIRHTDVKRFTYSGCFGATRRRYLAQDWEIQCRVWWDYNKPPEIQLTQGDTVAVKLVIGAETTWQGDFYTRRVNFEGSPSPTNPAIISASGEGILPQGATFLPCYCSPMAVFTYQEANCSSAGDEDGIVWQDVKLEGDSLLMYIGNTNDQATYTEYVGGIAGQNFIARG